MLYSLEGKVSRVDDEGIGIEVGGIGFSLFCSKSALKEASSSEAIKVLTFLHLTDSGPSLFGFMDEDERQLFLLLLKVRGVGAKLAIAIIRTLEFREIIHSIASDRSAVLCQVPGVGRKTAERLCFELKQSIEKLNFSLLSDMVSSDSGEKVQLVYDALDGLGFKRGEARKAVAGVIERLGEIPASTEELLRQTLTELQKN